MNLTFANLRLVALPVIAAANILSASASLSCTPLENSISELEDVKSAFSQGDYGNTLDFVAGLSMPADQIQKFRDELKTIYPNGFEVCETVISDVVSPKFREELAILGASGEEVLYFYWQVVNFRGEWVVMNFRITTNYSEIEERL